MVHHPVGNIAEKAVCRSVFLECIFDNMALYFDCRINQNALLQTVFWRFCLLGMIIKKVYQKNYLATCTHNYSTQLLFLAILKNITILVCLAQRCSFYNHLKSQWQPTPFIIMV